MKSVVIVLTAILLFTVSCKKSGDTDPVHPDPPAPVADTLLQFPQDVPGDSVMINSFPLAAGHSWTYRVRSQVYSTGDTGDIKEYDVTMSIISDSVVNGFHIYKMATTATGAELFLSDDVYEAFPSYYVQTNAGFYYLAGLGNIDSANIAASLVILRNQPAPWTYQHSSGYQPYKQTAGYVKVTTPIKTFNCLKVSTASHAGTWKYVDQYFSDKGLIQQTMNFKYEDISLQRSVYNLKVMTLKSVNF